MRVKLVVDRFEGEWAVLLDENDVLIKWPRHLLAEAAEGDVLQLELTVDAEATQKAREEAEALLKSL